MIRSRARMRMAILTVSGALAAAAGVQAEDGVSGQQPPTPASMAVKQEGPSGATAVELASSPERTGATLSKDCDRQRPSLTASFMRRLTGRPAPGPGQCPPEEAAAENRTIE